MLIFVILGLGLLFPSIAEVLSRPLVRVGGRLQSGRPDDDGIGKSLVLGVSTGLLWTPCAGPILGLILTGAAIQGPGVRSYGSHSRSVPHPLGIALFAGNQVHSAMKRSLTVEVWIRRALGVAVIAGVVAIAPGLGTSLLTKFPFVNTAKAEQRLIDAVHPSRPVVLTASAAEPQMAPFGNLKKCALFLTVGLRFLVRSVPREQGHRFFAIVSTCRAMLEGSVTLRRTSLPDFRFCNCHFITKSSM